MEIWVGFPLGDQGYGDMGRSGRAAAYQLIVREFLVHILAQHGGADGEYALRVLRGFRVVRLL